MKSKLLLLLLLTFSVSAKSDEPKGNWSAIWYCEARSYYTGIWTYWYSYNAAYARNQALSACMAYSGNTCTVACRWSY